MNKLLKILGISILTLGSLLAWYFVRTSRIIDPVVSYTTLPVARSFGVDVVNVAAQDMEICVYRFFAYEKYDKNIVYFSLSKIPDNLILDRKIELPTDLKEFLENTFHNPRIRDSARFEQDFWEEANKLGYTLDKLKNANVKEAVVAAAEIVASRITYFYVDANSSFIEKHGIGLSTDIYFHLGLGDCDKYAYATIGIFNIIKKLNSRLQNVYLSEGDLGGNHGTWHQWVSVVIPQDGYLILSHIDPTFYDNGSSLEASKYHITLDYDIFKILFYKRLAPFANHFDSVNNRRIYVYVYVYQFMREAFVKIKEARLRKWFLVEMSDINYEISYNKPLMALDNVSWILKHCETEGFKDNLDRILAYACYVYRNTNKLLELEKCRQRLLDEFPNSPWTDAACKD